MKLFIAHAASAESIQGQIKALEKRKEARELKDELALSKLQKRIKDLSLKETKLKSSNKLALRNLTLKIKLLKTKLQQSRK